MSAQIPKEAVGLTFMVMMIFLAGLLAVLGVVYQDGWAKGGVVAAVVIAILLYWDLAKDKEGEAGGQAASAAAS